MNRLLVEKKEVFRHCEKDMLHEIREVLGISAITNVRIINGYDIEGVNDIKKAKNVIFSEAGQDIVYDDKVDTTGSAYTLTTAAAVDQYDQREDFAATLLRVMEPGSKPIVRAFKQIILYGEITKADHDKIKSYYINPLETREIPDGATAPRVYTEPESVETIEGFIDFNDDSLEAFAAKYAVAMNMDDLRLCREYFNEDHRNPTITEIKALDTYWSDHCRHSTFLTVIDNVSIGENEFSTGLTRAQHLFEQAKEYVYGDSPRPLCLMDIATMEMKKLKKSGDLDDMEESEEVNACSIVAAVPVDGKPVDMIVMFKNETHNHPTEMEPFGGASTCLGGAIRDPLSGRAHVYGAIRVTGSGDPMEPVDETLSGKLPQRKITRTAAEGYSSYGNGIGLALGHLIEAYDPGFIAKRMECGAVLAAAEKENILRGKAKPGDIVVLVGGATGRDGCGGATGSSKEHDQESLEKGGAEVQKGNPVIERNIVRLFRKPHVSRLIKACNDFGAGGVCVAVGELADGLYIDLDKVPVKYPGLNGTELAISESQERMAVVLKAEDLELFESEANKENITAVKIADVTDSGRVVMTWRGDEILNIGSDFLNSGGIRRRTGVVVSPPERLFSEIKPADIKSAWLKNLADLNVCSKKGIANRFDSTIGGGTVFLPFGGIYQKSPEHGLAMRLPLQSGETDYGTLMTVGYNQTFGYRSPFHAALYAVVESVMKISVMGGDYRKVRLSFQEYFEKLTSDESWGKPYAALMGAFLAQDELGIPAIGGKDSMSGSYNDISVPPSLLSFAVAVTDMTKLVSRSFKAAGNKVYLLKAPVDESGIPDFKVLGKNMLRVHQLAQKGVLKSASVIGIGGIAAAVSEMAFGNSIGFSLKSCFTGDLFTPLYTSMILEVVGDVEEDFIPLGVTLESQVIIADEVTIPLDEALHAWENALETVFPVKNVGKISRTRAQDKGTGSLSSGAIDIKPHVLIPVFPGSTGEYELESHFRKAGADVSVYLFRTLTASEIMESYTGLAAAIEQADILAIPSGMSAGAEPDGSAKLIAMILRHPGVKKAVNDLTGIREGLVLGLGEGFKALVKTGLITQGQVQDEESGDIVLAKYPAGEYPNALRSVRIEHVTSPWLTGMDGDIETVPVSGLDGVVYMPQELYHECREKGQIAAQYLGEQPPYSVEAMTSENGLVLGRAGLVERLKKGLYINVQEATESKIFANAVNYISGR